MVQDVPECAGMVWVILYAMRYNRQLSIDHPRINMIFFAIVRGKSSSAPLGGSYNVPNHGWSYQPVRECNTNVISSLVSMH
jgi:hypothetical protein